MSTPTAPASKINYTASGKAMQTKADAAPIDAMHRHKEFLDARMTQIARWTTQGVKPEALVRFALMDMTGDKGAKLRECTPQSIYLGLLACAVTGLEPGALKGEAYLVPYRNKGTMEATFMAGYRGLIKQARRSKEIKAIGAQVVFERDEFDIDLGTANMLVHKPAMRDRGEIIGAYAIARTTTGVDEIEWMDRDDLDAVKAAGNSGPAWTDWADQMYRKAPYRRLCKRLPMGADYYVALALEHAPDLASQARIIDAHTDGEGERAQIAGATAVSMAAQANEPSEDELREISRQEREASK